MSLDVDERKKGSEGQHYFLGFRETVTLSIGLFDQAVTRSGLYKLYSKVHEQLNLLGVIEFSLPIEAVFNAMIRKLIKNGIIKEIYHSNNFEIVLTEAGEGSFDVILFHLESHPDSRKILHIFKLVKTQLN